MDQQLNNPPPSAQGGAPGHNALMGVLAYLSILVIIPFLTAKNDPFVKFHIKQGLVLVIIELFIFVIGSPMWQLWMLFNLVNLATIVLSIIGIVNVVNGQQKELPLVGSFAKNFTF